METQDCHKKGASHKKQLDQLKRIAGQVRGVGSMIEEDRYCVDILTQLKAIRSSLESVEKRILKQHIDHCVLNAVNSNDEKQAKEMVAEIQSLLDKVKL